MEVGVGGWVTRERLQKGGRVLYDVVHETTFPLHTDSTAERMHAHAAHSIIQQALCRT